MAPSLPSPADQACTLEQQHQRQKQRQPWVDPHVPAAPCGSIPTSQQQQQPPSQASRTGPPLALQASPTTAAFAGGRWADLVAGAVHARAKGEASANCMGIAACVSAADQDQSSTAAAGLPTSPGTSQCEPLVLGKPCEQHAGLQRAEAGSSGRTNCAASWVPGAAAAAQAEAAAAVGGVAGGECARASCASREAMLAARVDDLKAEVAALRAQLHRGGLAHQAEIAGVLSEAAAHEARTAVEVAAREHALVTMQLATMLQEQGHAALCAHLEAATAALLPAVLGRAGMAQPAGGFAALVPPGASGPMPPAHWQQHRQPPSMLARMFGAVPQSLSGAAGAAAAAQLHAALRSISSRNGAGGAGTACSSSSPIPIGSARHAQPSSRLLHPCRGASAKGDGAHVGFSVSCAAEATSTALPSCGVPATPGALPISNPAAQAVGCSSLFSPPASASFPPSCSVLPPFSLFGGRGLRATAAANPAASLAFQLSSMAPLSPSPVGAAAAAAGAGGATASAQWDPHGGKPGFNMPVDPFGSLANGVWARSTEALGSGSSSSGSGASSPTLAGNACDPGLEALLPSTILD